MSRSDPRHQVMLEIDGQTRPLKEWCIVHNVPYISAYRRLARGKVGKDVLDVSMNPARISADLGKSVGVPWELYNRLVKHAVRLETPTNQLAIDCIEVCLNKLDKKESV
jgi:hypothetical protein